MAKMSQLIWEDNFEQDTLDLSNMSYSLIISYRRMISVLFFEKYSGGF